MGATDASLEFLKSLDDPTKYVVKRRVPIFYAHTKESIDPKTGKKITKEVTEADLPEWLEQLQAAEEANGVAGVLRIGHINTDPDSPETAQPPVGGYIKNAVLDRFGPQSKLGILVDEYAKKEFVPDLQNMPRRSVEMYRPRKLITAVAALTRDPQLPDLGFVPYSRSASGEPVECYSLESFSMDPMAPTEAGYAAAGATNAAPPGETKPETMEKKPETPDMNSLVAAIVKAVLEHLNPAKAETKPEEKTEVDPGKKPEEEAVPVTLSNKERAELYALETQLASERKKREAQDARLAAIERERDEAKVERYIAELDAEGYVFTAAEEREALLELPNDAARKKYVERARKNYTRLPEGRLETYRGNVETSDQDNQQAQARDLEKKVVRHMMANPGMSRDEALKQVSKA